MVERIHGKAFHKSRSEFIDVDPTELTDMQQAIARYPEQKYIPNSSREISEEIAGARDAKADALEELLATRAKIKYTTAHKPAKRNPPRSLLSRLPKENYF